MNVWIGNLAPGTTVENLEQLLEQFGLPHPEKITPTMHGTMLAMNAEFRTEDLDCLRERIWRIEGMYWMGRRLIVVPLHF